MELQPKYSYVIKEDAKLLLTNVLWHQNNFNKWVQMRVIWKIYGDSKVSETPDQQLWVEDVESGAIRYTETSFFFCVCVWWVWVGGNDLMPGSFVKFSENLAS